MKKIKKWLQSLSFRTGVIVLALCVPFYLLTFAQMLLPISAELKGVLWFVLFGLAKCCQYGGLEESALLGKGERTPLNVEADLTLTTILLCFLHR